MLGAKPYSPPAPEELPSDQNLPIKLNQ